MRLIFRPVRRRIAHTQVARHAKEDFCLAKWLEREVVKACAYYPITLRSVCRRGYGGDLYVGEVILRGGAISHLAPFKPPAFQKFKRSG